MLFLFKTVDGKQMSEADLNLHGFPICEGIAVAEQHGLGHTCASPKDA